MEHALWLASIFGPIMVIMGLWLFFHADQVTKIWSSMKTNPGIFYMGGIFNLLIGVVILSMYHTWSWELTALVTLLGYVQVIRALLVFFAPHAVMKWTSKLVHNKNIQMLSIIPFIWGLALCKLAFFA